MKYIVDIVKKMPESANYNAWAKAPADVIRTLVDKGCSPVFIVVPGNNSLFACVKALIHIFLFVKSVKQSDILFVQRYGYFINLLCFLAKRKKAKVHYIVHDLTFLRFGNENSGKLEKRMIKMVDVLYVHTIKMRDKVRQMGYNIPMKVMHLFDYYSDDEMVDVSLKNKQVVAFAGNLEKSGFLRPLLSSNIPSDMEYRLYGMKCSLDLSCNNSVKYMGAFKPNNTSAVNAGWGLLWDGNQIETCNGPLGEYLKINSSHKISLYLACGLPVIVWKESSLATWLSQQGVCITISSLNEIEESIKNITDKEYLEMARQAKRLGTKLRNGGMLKELLSDQ